MNLIYGIINANKRVKASPNAVVETPLEKSYVLSKKTGANIFLKYESLQLTGSFKLRGATNKLSLLSKIDREKGIITASSGNHGLGVAMASHLLGIKATIYVPYNVAPTKENAILQLGATLKKVNGDGYIAEQAAIKAANDQNKTYISPYNDMDIICGQGSVGVELMAQLPALDAIFVAVGGGGLIGGIGTYVKSISKNVEIVGCWPEVAKSFYHALIEGKVVEVEEGPTLSDGTAGGVDADTITLEICQQVIDNKILVSELEIAQAMKIIVNAERQIIEGSAGVAVAAALKAIEAAPVKYKDKYIVIVLCGRNIAYDKFSKIITELD